MLRRVARRMGITAGADRRDMQCPEQISLRGGSPRSSRFGSAIFFREIRLDVGPQPMQACNRGEWNIGVLGLRGPRQKARVRREVSTLHDLAQLFQATA
jgi:hypothetical protein